MAETNGETLLEATREGDATRVRALLDTGAPVDAKDSGGQTALMAASEEGRTDVARLLVSQEADVDDVDDNERTALMYASWCGYIDVARLLVNHGADVNAGDEFEMTSLMYASERGHIDVARFLVGHDADISAVDADGKTALMYASRRGQIDVARFLVDQDADVNAVDDGGKTPLMYASERGDMDVARLLIGEDVNINAADEFGKTALMYASTKARMHVARFLVDQGADINAFDNDGMTALMYAAQGGHTDVVQFLVNQGADGNAVDVNRKTAMMYASEEGHLDVARFFVDQGADFNTADVDGKTAMMIASAGGHKDVVCLLIDRGVNVHTVDIYRKTVLMYASEGGSIDIVRLLVDQGVDINAVESTGMTPLMYAAQGGHRDVIQFLVDQGADVNAADKYGKTVLMYMSERGHMEVVQFLLDRDVDVNAVDVNGKTAVFFAAKEGHTALQHFLTSLLHANSNATYSHLDALQDYKSQSSSKWLITPFEIALCTQVDNQNVGVQFRAKWLDADVVIRLFIPSASMASFADEVTVWRQLRHPNVIKLYGACNFGHYFFVFEFASNGTLADYLSACRRTGAVYTPWKFLHEAALGLAYLHERNIVHGDLRGSTILIGSDGLAKLSEFSLSGLTEGSAGSGVFGSTRWQPPERIWGGVPASFASDVYSLGLCIVEAMSGETPWADEHDDSLILWKRDWDPRYRARSSFAPGTLTDDVVDLISQMCALDPKKRVAASVAAQMLERLATQEQSKRQARKQPEPEPNISIDKYDKFKNGELTRLWTKTRTAVQAHADNGLYRSVFDEAEAMYAKLGESTRPWELLEQFRKLLVDIEITMRPDSFQNRIQRLSATRATGFAMVGLRRRLDGIWSALKGSPSELKAYKEQRREQQVDHPELFISEEDKMLLVLKELKSEEDWWTLKKILKSEIDGHGSDYTPGQLAVIQKAYADLVEHNKSDVVMTTPEWFLPLYELDIDEASCVGAGGFGGVYRGRWLESEVVVKLLDQGDSARQAIDDSTFASYSSWSVSTKAPATPVDHAKKKQHRQMFEREVSVWFGLSHPHIVRLFGACHIGTLFFACEYASKGSLDGYLRKHPDEMWQKLYEAALGVQYLHARGVIHGDLKCNNILVGGDGKAKVTDFGLSSDTAELDKADPQVSGASHWVAPECLEHGASKLSAASDVYSLGMCVVEALRVVEMVTPSLDRRVRYPLPWGELDNSSVKYHVVRAKELPLRPQLCSDGEWDLVTRMCRSNPEDRLKISTVVDELGKLVRIRESVAPERVASASEQVRISEPMLELSSDTEISTQDSADCLPRITPSLAATTVVDSMPIQFASIPVVIAQMQASSRSTDDGNLQVLNKIFGLLWDRMAHLSSVVLGSSGDLESLQELVQQAEESTKKVSEVKDSLIEFTVAAMRGYALHRDLDKIIEAKFWRVDTGGGEVHEWQSRCNEFLGVTGGCDC